MRFRSFLLGSALVLLTSCTCPNRIELDSRWKPLDRIEQRDSVPEGMFQTDGTVIYTRDLCVFLGFNSVDQIGLLKHEQLHGLRQLSSPGGPVYWLAMYNTDRQFRWKEEAAGWEIQIKYVVQHGRSIDIEYVCGILNTAYIYQGVPMVSLEEARSFVLKCIADSR